MSNARTKAKDALERITRVFKENTKLRENFETLLDAKQDEDAHAVAKKLAHTYAVLHKHERLLLNLEMREGLEEFEKAQREQLYDLELLERAIKFLAGHPEAEKQIKDIQKEEREFLYSAREELKKL